MFIPGYLSQLSGIDCINRPTCIGREQLIKCYYYSVYCYVPVQSL